MESKSTDELEKILGSTHINEVSAYLKSNEESIITNEYAFHEYISNLIKLKNLRKQDVFLTRKESNKIFSWRNKDNRDYQKVKDKDIV